MPDHVFRCVNVAAVSTPGQAADDKASIPTQVRENSDIIARMGWMEVAQVVIPGHSRNYMFMSDLIADCPEYGELVRLIESEQVDLVVCWRWDRIWRNQWIGTDLERIMALHRTQVFARFQGSLPSPPDTVSDWRLPGFRNIDKKVDQAASEEFLKSLRAKHRVGMESLITDSGKHQCVKPAYGYELDEDRNLVVVPAEAERVRWIYSECIAGISPRAISIDLTRQGVPSPSAHPQRGNRPGNTFWWRASVLNILRKRLYLGVAYWGQAENARAHHEPIITQDVYDRAQIALERRSRTHGKKHDDVWISGIITCGFCQGAMIAGHDRGRHYFVCARHKRTRGKECTNNGNSGKKVQGYIQEQIIGMLSDRDAWLMARTQQHNLPEITQRLSAIESQIAANRMAHVRAYEAYLAGASSPDELKASRDRLDAEHAALISESAALEGTLTSAEHALAIYKDVAAIASEFADLPTAHKSRIAHLLVQRIYLRIGDDPVIVWA